MQRLEPGQLKEAAAAAVQIDPRLTFGQTQRTCAVCGDVERWTVARAAALLEEVCDTCGMAIWLSADLPLQ